MFEIIIIQKEIKMVPAGREWKEMLDEPNEKGTRYGYTPAIEKPREVETELLRQTVETLDLVAVIKAVNGL